MSQVYANSINGNPIYATRAEQDQNGLNIDQTYAKKTEVPAAQEQSNWSQNDSSAVDFIKNKPQNLVQDANYVHTDNNFTDTDEAKLAGIEAGAEVNVQADWNQSNSSADDYIKNKPSDLVQDANYVHTDNNFTNAEKTKLSGIEAGAEANVQSDWNQTNSSADDYIKNKPTNLVQDASYVHTDNNFTDSLKNKLDGIEAGAEVNVQPDWSQSDSTAPDYIKNKPQNLVQDADYVHTDNNFTNAEKTKLSGIEAGAEANVQADWNQSDSSADDYIKNKPTIPTVPTTDQTYNASSSNPQSGTAVAEAIGGVRQVPASTSADSGKVLKVDSNGDLEWSSSSSASVEEIELTQQALTSRFGTIGALYNELEAGKNFLFVYTESGSNRKKMFHIVEWYPTEVRLSRNRFSNYFYTNNEFCTISNGLLVSITETYTYKFNPNDWIGACPGYIPAGEYSEGQIITVSTQDQGIWAPVELYKCILGYTEGSSTHHPKTDTTHWVQVYLKDLINEIEIQPDWNVTDQTSPAYIKNKPTIPIITYTTSQEVTDILADLT